MLSIPPSLPRKRRSIAAADGGKARAARCSTFCSRRISVRGLSFCKNFAVLFILTTAAQAAIAGDAQAPLPRIIVHINGHALSAEVAATEQSRRRGLMFRRRLAAGDAMLFQFAETARHCLWMRDTLIPLSAAFIGEAGAIINIVQMRPQTETPHCAAAPAAYALETPQGWFAANGVKPGDAVQELPTGK